MVNTNKRKKEKEKTSIQRVIENIHIFQYKSVFGQTSVWVAGVQNLQSAQREAIW